MLESLTSGNHLLVAMALRIYALVASLLSISSHGQTTQGTPQPGVIRANETTLASASGVYNSSVTPSNLAWDTYNYCNAPHVNAAHYSRPDVSGAKLVYLNTVMRHHKRTPDNLYPQENMLNTPWDCLDFQQFLHGGPGAAQVFHETDTPAWHPFLSTVWNGTCDMGQLTRGGFEDAIRHGKVSFSLTTTWLGIDVHML